MQSMFFKASTIVFKDHPRFAGVKLAVLISSKDSLAVSVSVLAVSPGGEIPIHTHDPQADSIYVVSGQGEGYINGEWQGIQAGDYIFVPDLVEHGMRNTGTDPLMLFVHHSPPLL